MILRPLVTGDKFDNLTLLANRRTETENRMREQANGDEGEAMSYRAEIIGEIPEETRRVAQAVCPDGNVYMRMRDELGLLFERAEFDKLYARVGQPGLSAWRLTLVTIMQFAEGLSDRQTAEAVRLRIDWKYALGLSLTDEGFNASVLSEFRERLVEREAADYFLNLLLEHFKTLGLLKTWKQQRTDATHILGNLRALNQVDLLGETLRASLNALAVADPDWLRGHVPTEWYERYGQRIDSWHLPRSAAKREALGLQIAADGSMLLSAIHEASEAPYLRRIPAVQTLRQVWVQQVLYTEDKVALRGPDNLPPAHLRIQSPYETEAHYGTKHDLTWLGYKVHVTETCAQDDLHLITHVETTAATTPDFAPLPTIHAALDKKELRPERHIVDEGYTTTRAMLDAQQDYGIELLGPVHTNRSWQTKDGQGFDLSQFHIDWQHQQVTCPAGHTSQRWYPLFPKGDEPLITVRFPIPVCRPCPVHHLCTRRRARVVSFLPQPMYDTLQAARAREQTEDFKTAYKRRAGVENTFSQGVRAFDMRRSRYRGLDKTHLQNVFTVIAINIVRTLNWLAQPFYSPPYVSPFAAMSPT
jgi:transposase